MKHLKVIPILLLTAFLLSPSHLLGASPLTLKPSPDGAYFVGNSVTLEAKIQRADGDRKLQVILDCVGFYSDSIVDVTEKSPSTYRVRFVNIPPGDCQGMAILFREEKNKIKEYVAVTRVLTVYSEKPSPFGA